MQVQFDLIAAATSAHYDSFKHLLVEYAHTDLADAKHSSIWADLAQLPGRYAPPSGLTLLAGVGDQVVACGAFVATAQPGLAEIKRVYIRPGFRRQGLARILTLALLEQARSASYQTVGICTWSHNTAALALYQTLGFAPIACFRESDKAHLIFLGMPLGPASQHPANPRHSDALE